MKSKVSFLSFIAILFFLVSLSNGESGNDAIKRLQGCRKGSRVQGLHYLKLYLARFHIPDHVNSEDDEFDEKLETALKSYQNFYHLNATGTLDEPTVSLMLMPRCGQPDMQTHKHTKKLLHIVSHYTFFQNNPKWPKNQLTYAFDLNYPNAYIPPVDRAFNTWASVTGYFIFSRVGDISGADLKISFLSGDHGDGAVFETNTLAHAFRPTDGRFHYNADKIWSVGPGAVPGANDLETVALHEIGHLLGLNHSQDENAIMWSILPTGNVKGLNSDDIQGIEVLYGIN